MGFFFGLVFVSWGMCCRVCLAAFVGAPVFVFELVGRVYRLGC